VDNIDNILWLNPGHKQRRYDLAVSENNKLFKKSTNRLHDTLSTELKCLQFAKDLGLNRIQRVVDGNIDREGISYIITEHCGRNLTRSRVPTDWREQLLDIDDQLNMLITTHKVYHNDVQVRNCFINNDGQLRIIDFDLATIGKPNRRSSGRPGFLNCDFIRDKIIDRWNIK